jgi:ribA/ribD-fused uncharacterized protein
MAQITKEGNLLLVGKDGRVIHDIIVPSYRAPDADYYKALEKRRQAAIKQAEEAFEAARDSLRDLLSVEETSMGEIKEAMRFIRDADVALQSARFAAKEVAQYAMVPLQMLTLNKYDRGRVNVGMFSGTPISLQDRYAIEQEPGSTPVKTAEPITDVLIVCYAEGDHGFMSSWFMKPLLYDGIEYNCAFQAIMVGMARKFDNDEEAERIMGESDPKDMALTWDTFEDKEDEKPITEEKWNKRLLKLITKVNKAKFKNSKLAQKLANTGSTAIGYVPPENPSDDYQGTGIPLDDPDAYQPRKWTGSNVYGQVLEQIRLKALTALAEVRAKSKKKAKAPVPEVPTAEAPAAADAAEAADAPAAEVPLIEIAAEEALV